MVIRARSANSIRDRGTASLKVRMYGCNLIPSVFSRIECLAYWGRPCMSGLAPRWAAQQPSPTHRVLSGQTHRQALGPLRSPAQASLLTTGKLGATYLYADHRESGQDTLIAASLLFLVSKLRERLIGWTPPLARYAVFYNCRSGANAGPALRASCWSGSGHGSARCR